MLVLAGCTGDATETTASPGTLPAATTVAIAPRVAVGETQSDGGSVVVQGVDAAGPGFVVVVASGADPAAVPLGVSALLGGPQQHAGVVVHLAPPLAPQAAAYELQAVLYADDGDGVWTAQDEVVLRSDPFPLLVG